jgi:hypothetical protein
MTEKKTTTRKRRKRVSVSEGTTALVGANAKEKRENDDLNVKIADVIETLEALGYDPVKKLVEARNGANLNEFQKVAIDKELMKYVHPQKKAVDVNGEINHGLNITFSDLEDEL